MRRRTNEGNAARPNRLGLGLIMRNIFACLHNHSTQRCSTHCCVSQSANTRVVVVGATALTDTQPYYKRTEVIRMTRGLTICEEGFERIICARLACEEGAECMACARALTSCRGGCTGGDAEAAALASSPPTAPAADPWARHKAGRGGKGCEGTYGDKNEWLQDMEVKPDNKHVDVRSIAVGLMPENNGNA